MINYLDCGGSRLDLTKPVVMGILNTTPDSFSDGGRFSTIGMALSRALEMYEQGAQIIDVGGESTRPGAPSVSVEDELQRVLGVIESIRKETDAVISIDTSKPEVMRAAVAAGATMINDVRALRATGAIEVCAELNVPVCLMHMQGEPRTMQLNPQYDDVVKDVKSFFEERVSACIRGGIAKQRLLLDPGFGFGKALAHNLSLLKRLNELTEMGFPLLVGISRKSMLGSVLDNAAVSRRLYGSLAAAVLAYAAGAKILRVHDVRATVEALKVSHAVLAAS